MLDRIAQPAGPGAAGAFDPGAEEARRAAEAQRRGVGTQRRAASSEDARAPGPAERPVPADDRFTPSTPGDPAELTDEQRRELDRLRERDRRVRAHEQAHVAAAGGLYRGGPTYQFEVGPDGKRYAVGGSVKIDTSGVPGDPEATARKAQQIRRAALAPMDPSSQDRRVAAEAGSMEREARAAASQRDARRRADDLARSAEEGAPGDAPRPARLRDVMETMRPTFELSNLGDGALAREPEPDLRTRPSDDLYTRPSDDLYTRPSDDLYAEPGDGAGD